MIAELILAWLAGIALAAETVYIVYLLGQLHAAKITIAAHMAQNVDLVKKLQQGQEMVQGVLDREKARLSQPWLVKIADSQFDILVQEILTRLGGAIGIMPSNSKQIH